MTNDRSYPKKPGEAEPAVPNESTQAVDMAAFLEAAEPADQAPPVDQTYRIQRNQVAPAEPLTSSAEPADEAPPVDQTYRIQRNQVAPTAPAEPPASSAAPADQEPVDQTYRIQRNQLVPPASSVPAEPPAENTELLPDPAEYAADLDQTHRKLPIKPAPTAQPGPSNQPAPAAQPAPSAQSGQPGQGGRSYGAAAPKPAVSPGQAGPSTSAGPSAQQASSNQPAPAGGASRSYSAKPSGQPTPSGQPAPSNQPAPPTDQTQRLPYGAAASGLPVSQNSSAPVTPAAPSTPAASPNQPIPQVDQTQRLPYPPAPSGPSMPATQQVNQPAAANPSMPSGQPVPLNMSVPMTDQTQRISTPAAPSPTPSPESTQLLPDRRGLPSNQPPLVDQTQLLPDRGQAQPSQAQQQLDGTLQFQAPTLSQFQSQPRPSALGTPTPTLREGEVRQGGLSAPPGSNEAEYRHFGPGVPGAAPNQAAAVWRGEASPPQPAPRKRRRALAGWLLALVILLIVLGVLAWFRFFGPPVKVTGATVHAPTAQVTCNQTATVTGTLETNGDAGTVTYQWKRSDGTESAVLQQHFAKGTHQANVVLLWTFSGQGSLHATATLDVLTPNVLSAAGSFDYSCLK
jgi:hypothetical protein